MPAIIIENLNSKTIHYEDKRENLLKILLSKLDWMHACGAKGRCTTCRAQVIEGIENLMPLTTHEERFRKMNRLREDERLMCQTLLRGDQVKVRVPEACQLPHMHYSSYV